MTRTYANASSQRVHRVSKRLHKTCAKPPRTPSSEKSGFVRFRRFFRSHRFQQTQRSQRPRAHVSSHQPRPKAAAPHPTVGLVGASPCGTRPNIARPQATQRASDASTPAFIHVDRERNQAADSTPRSARRTLRPNQRVAGHGEMGDWGPVAPFAASGWGERSLVPMRTIQRPLSQQCTSHTPSWQACTTRSPPSKESAQWPPTGAAVATQRRHTRIASACCP